jgi:hypothetical protein
MATKLKKNIQENLQGSLIHDFFVLFSKGTSV